MKRYVLDTSIALAYIRGHELYAQVEADLTLTAPDTQVLISVVNKAESWDEPITGDRRSFQNSITSFPNY